MANEPGIDGDRLPEEEEPPRIMTHTMRERLSEKNGPRKTVFGVLSNKKYEVGSVLPRVYHVYTRVKGTDTRTKGTRYL